MKKVCALILAFVMVLSLAACGGSGNDNSNSNSNSGSQNADSQGSTGGSGDVTDVNLKVWVPEEELSLMQTLADSFNAAHPEYNFSVELAVEGIDEANSLLKTDADSAADIFQVASGGIPELSQKGLLLPLVYDTSDYAEGAITSVTGDDGLVYAVPFAPNTFFMYYNSSMFTEDDVKSLETMLDKDLGGDVSYNVAFPINGSWYIESFFFAAGCTLFGPDGKDPTSMDWNNANGFAAGKYVIDLMKNPKFIDDADGIGMSLLREGKVGAIFTGTWDAANVQEALGDNYAAAKLPTISLNGADCQLRNFGDYKTYAVKSNTAYPKAAQEFAAYICNAESQLARYEDQGVSPCISSLADDPALAGDPATAALVAQSEWYYPQPSIPQINEYWTPASALCSGFVNGEITEANLQAQLDALVQAVTTTLTD